jgi:hypothetical protein
MRVVLARRGLHDPSHTCRFFGMDAIHKKTLNLDEARLKRARRILRQPTDTATIHAALDRVIEGDAILDDLLAVAGKGRGLFRIPRPRGGRRPRA